MAIKYGPIMYKVVNKPTYPTVTVTNSGTVDFILYDGQDATGESLQVMTAGSTFTATCTSGYLYADFASGEGVFTGTDGVSTGVNPAVVTGDGTWDVAVTAAAWGGTDLTGTTWQLNDRITLPSSEVTPVDGAYNDLFSVSFSSNSSNYVGFSLTSSKGRSWNILLYKYSTYTAAYMGGWCEQGYRTISITGGTDATNTDLISWLQSNATLVSW